MIRHYLKLVWNRKRSNLLVMVEIFMAFLVVFAVVALGVYYANNYRQPLGFDYKDVWCISITRHARGEGSITPDSEGGGPQQQEQELARLQEASRQLFAAVRELPEVVSLGGFSSSPYGNSRWTSNFKAGGMKIDYSVNMVTDGAGETLRLRPVRGRWFGPEDDGATSIPVVLNERMAQAVFGDRDPVGKELPRDKNSDGTFDTPMRVVGVIQDFRQSGELSAPERYLFHRQPLDGPTLSVNERRPPETLLVRLQPGTTAAFEERLMKRLQAAAPDWSFEVKPLEQMRETRFNETLAPLTVGGVIAGFLLLMVGMGLTGVLWQTVTQRTREIGLRRAKGASIGHIRLQILGELVVMTTVALTLGVAIVVQFPLLESFSVVTPAVYAVSLVISVACIYLLTVACAWYPARMATSIAPAEALRYE